MRVASWRGPEVFQKYRDIALRNGDLVMDGVVTAAKARCPVDPTLYRSGGFVTRNVKFTPKSGRNKGELVEFRAKTWKGRFPGQLKNTIRRTNRYGSGTIRVYAGNYKVYYARFVERGTRFAKPKPYLKPAFNAIKSTLLSKLSRGGG